MSKNLGPRSTTLADEVCDAQKAIEATAQALEEGQVDIAGFCPWHSRPRRAIMGQMASSPQDQEPPISPLDVLLVSRFGGAVNIRGIRFQLIYSLLRSFDMYDPGGPSSMRLEGLEDLDLRTVQMANQYIQVKTSEKAWSWARLQEPLKNFAEVCQHDPQSRFVLVFNFDLRGDIKRLSEYPACSPANKRKIRNQFLDLCKSVGIKKSVADDLLTRISIASESEGNALDKVRRRITEHFGVGSRAVEVYIRVLFERMLTWAMERRTITPLNISEVVSEIGEALAAESNFQAVGRGLISRIDWSTPTRADDFFEGKHTTPGHVQSRLDVARAEWISRISKALTTNKTCVLRAPSGQGKSTLILRYARDHWTEGSTFVLKIAESEEQAEAVCDYIRFQKRIGIAPLLLIDNISWKTQHWARIAYECSMAGGQTLAAVRNEDWFRFGPSGTGGYEVLEPSLTLEEAKGIFSLFSVSGRCHPSVDSPIWAYERIGTPRLLMEYVYYLTHGTMLEERLESQLKSITTRGEDSAKIEILRRTSLGSVCGVPILLEPLVADVGHRDDVQHILQSLDGEYLTIEGNVATGLHHVRSEHLARILHRIYPNPAQTAVKTLPSVPRDQLPAFVAGVFRYPGVDRTHFMKGLTSAIKTDVVPTAVKILEGLFTAGEHDFLETNQSLYDEVYELFGSAGLTFLGSHLLPVVKVDDALRSIEHNAKGGSFSQIRQIAERASGIGGRGRNLCKQFLELFCPTISAADLTQDLASSGIFLDWCGLCGVRTVAWDSAHEQLLADPSLFDLDIEPFWRIMQGFYRLDRAFYKSWFEANSGLVRGYLRVHTKSVRLLLDEDDSVTREFLVLGDAKVACENNLIQLERLRSALPFCKVYKSRGIRAIHD